MDIGQDILLVEDGAEIKLLRLPGEGDEARVEQRQVEVGRGEEDLPGAGRQIMRRKNRPNRQILSWCCCLLIGPAY